MKVMIVEDPVFPTPSDQHPINKGVFEDSNGVQKFSYARPIVQGTFHNCCWRRRWRKSTYFINNLAIRMNDPKSPSGHKRLLATV